MSKFKHWGVKTRTFIDKNYHAIWVGESLETHRLCQDPQQLSPGTQEFYDVSLGTKCNLECPFCFLPKSKVLLSNGLYKNIEDIEIGDELPTKNEVLGVYESNIVEQLHCREYMGEIIIIETDNGNLQVTPNHKIFTINRGWVEASQLTEHDDIELFTYEKYVQNV